MTIPYSWYAHCGLNVTSTRQKNNLATLPRPWLTFRTWKPNESSEELCLDFFLVIPCVSPYGYYSLGVIGRGLWTLLHQHVVNGEICRQHPVEWTTVSITSSQTAWSRKKFRHEQQMSARVWRSLVTFVCGAGQFVRFKVDFSCASALLISDE